MTYYDDTRFHDLNDRLRSTFGESVPAEIQARADEITQDGVITVQEWADFLDFMHEWTLKNGVARRDGDAVFVDLPNGLPST